MSIDLSVALADANTLLDHAVKLLRLHVVDRELKPGCDWNNGEPCHSCRTIAFLNDNFPTPTEQGSRLERAR